jgi:hypothetical protein
MLKKDLNGSLDKAKVDLVTVRQVATKKGEAGSERCFFSG